MTTCRIISTSNGLSDKALASATTLIEILTGAGYTVSSAETLADRGDGVSAPAPVRAEELMSSLETAEWTLDVSGGNRATDVLSYLDEGRLRAASGTFVGYSDLTTIHSALTHATTAPGLLLSPLALVESEARRAEFFQYVEESALDIATFDVTHISGPKAEVSGELVGGNLRSLLKLAGTPYFPTVEGKILVLEGRSSDPNVLIPQLDQLFHMGVFKQVKGLVCGQFTSFEQGHPVVELYNHVISRVPASLGVWRTDEIGHFADAKAGAIGARYHLDSSVAKPVQP